MGELLKRINEVLDRIFQISPQNVKTYCHNGPWNTTLCKIVFDRYLQDTGGQPELAERTLELMHIVRSFFGIHLIISVVSNIVWVELEAYIYKTPL